jgi:chromosome segregation ATPase
MPAHVEGLTRLIERFTAERDELLVRIQECQERVTDLVQSLGTPDGASGEASLPAEHVHEVRAAVEVLRAEISGLEAEQEARLEADSALQAALGEVRDTMDGHLVALEAEIGAALDRFTQIEGIQSRMEATMEHLIQTGSSVEARDREVALLRERIETLAASLTRMSEGMEDIGALRASLSGLHRHIDELAAQSARSDVTAGLSEGLTEVRLAIAGLKNQMRSLDTAITSGLRSTQARWDDEARGLAARIDDVTRLFAAHAEAHRHSLQDRATEWARIAGTMVATEIQRLGTALLPRWK